MSGQLGFKKTKPKKKTMKRSVYLLLVLPMYYDFGNGSEHDIKYRNKKRTTITRKVTTLRRGDKATEKVKVDIVLRTKSLTKNKKQKTI